MKRVAIYTSFVAASLTDAAIFVTATTNIQLVVAVVLYLPLTYFAFKLFPRKARSEQPALQKGNVPQHTVPTKDIVENAITQQHVIEDVEVSDINKRAFLKLIGATGISFFISSLFSRKLGTNILGRAEDPGMTKIQNPAGNIINPAEHHPTDNYRVSEVDYGVSTFYGFIDRGEGWFIMKEDINAGTYRYVKGNINFRDNWNNREDLKYDYFNRVFPKS